MEALTDTWKNLQQIIKQRDAELAGEEVRQEENDKLRKEFARHANAFYSWLTDTRAMMMEGSGTLEEQLAAVGIKVSRTKICCSKYFVISTYFRHMRCKGVPLISAR